MRRAYVFLVVVGACAAGACIIGPKQDDPLVDRTTDSGVLADSALGLDLGTTSDSEITTVTDTVSPPANADGDADGGDGDAPTDGDARSDGDVATDSVMEGG